MVLWSESMLSTSSSGKLTRSITADSETNDSSPIVQLNLKKYKYLYVSYKETRMCDQNNKWFFFNVFINIFRNGLIL